MPLMRKGEDVREANSPYIYQSLKAHGFVEVASEEVAKSPRKPRVVHVKVKDKSPRARKVKVRVK